MKNLMYKFKPNEFGSNFFSLDQAEYGPHDSTTGLLELVLGKPDYKKYMLAQDPLPNGKSKGTISIIVNPDEDQSHRWIFYSIGEIFLNDTI